MSAIISTHKQHTGLPPNGIDKGMAALEAAAAAKDEQAFGTAFKTVQWEDRQPEEFMHTVDLALMAGAYLVARKVAAMGAQRYPKHAELQKMAHVLAPPTVTVTQSNSQPTWYADRQWLKSHWQEYRGQWVALRQGQLLGAATSLDALVEQVGNIKGTDILVTPITMRF